MTDGIVQPLRANRQSLAVQAQRYLGGLIHDGTYQPGEQLPSQADLAAQLGISRATLREALLNLEQDGLIVRRHGIGTFVAPDSENRLESGLERLESIWDLAAREGLEIRVDALEVRTEPADAKVSEKLRLERGEPVTCVRRVIKVGKRPAAYMVDLIPPAILDADDLEKESFKGSVLDVLRQEPGQLATQALAEIVALNADSALAARLGVERGQAILLLEEVVFDEQGRPVEFSRNYFVPDCFRFHVVRR